MKIWILLLSFFFVSSNLWSQKPAIQFSDLDTWPYLSGAQLSSDGKYILYNVINQVWDTRTIVIKSCSLDWEKQISNGRNPHITWDSREVIFSLPGDSLGILELGTNKIEFIADVKDYQVSKEKTGIWIAYLKTDIQHTLILKNKSTKEEKQFHHVNYYAFSDYGSALILREADTLNGRTKYSIVYVNLSDGCDKVIWKNESGDNIKIDDPILNPQGTQSAFCIRETRDGHVSSSIYCYRQPNEQAFKIYSDSSLQDNEQLRLADVAHFNRNNDLLFIHLTEIERDPCIKMDMAKVDVWSYQDYKLQSEQLSQLNEKKMYLAGIDLSNGHFLQLTKENETAQIFDPFYIDDKYIVINAMRHDVDDGEASWNGNYQMTIYLENVYTGERKFVGPAVSGISNGAISPNGEYFVYYDGSTHNYFSYNILSNSIHNITKGINADWSNAEHDLPIASLYGQGIAGWVAGGQSILIYDQSDIWLIDLRGQQPAVNITNGYGRRHSIRLVLPVESKINILNPEDTLILRAFDTNTKQCGFYLKAGLKSGNPTVLSIGDYFFGKNFHGDSFLTAKNINVYVVQRESCTEFPNYFITKDFKSFFSISRLEPEKAFNWMTSRLVNWKTFDSADCQGILYLPGNFNPANKYPLIVHYYEKRSDELNRYFFPALASGDINIPWFVSNGYIVFVPDIHYKIEYPGVSAYNCIVSGVQMLAKYRWIDKQRMGLQGHSFGGYETDYVITHSNMFVAAISASGVSDLIADYLSLRGKGVDQLGFFETGQIRMNFNLWQNKKLYILNSPIFNVDKVQTPLLMMNNKGDDVVPFSQGIEFYLALRRLGKKAWMLQYDGEGHSVLAHEAKADYTMRMTEFFKYFLKDSSEPQWMRQGIPATEKGCKDGF